MWNEPRTVYAEQLAHPSGADPTLVRDLVIPDIPHRIGRTLGTGGTSRVHEALLDGQAEAVKFPMTDNGRAIAGEAIVDLFLNEGELQSAHSRHPHVNPIHSFGIAPNGIPYILSELVDSGENLSMFLTRTGLQREASFSFSNYQVAAFCLFAELAGTIEYLRRNGIRFRDIKPANVLIKNNLDDGSLSAKLIDFGLASKVDATGTAASKELEFGTLPFLAPEILEQIGTRFRLKPASDRSEMYSLGATLYEVVSGSAPMRFADTVLTRPQDSMLAFETTALRAPSATKAGVPLALDQVCLKATNVLPERRFGSPMDLIEELCYALPQHVGDLVKAAATRSSSWPL